MVYYITIKSKFTGNLGKVFCLDSSPLAMKTMLDHRTKSLSISQQQTSLIIHLCRLLHATKPLGDLESKLDAENSWEHKLNIAMEWLKYENCSYFEFSRTILNLAWKRIVQTKNYKMSFKKLKSNIILLKGNNDFGLPDDYGFNAFSNNLTVHNLNASHLMVPYDSRCSNIVNKELRDI